ncbi:MAG: glycoside hydrolase family 3 C-terminal domain-containing protein [Lachnospiraceae bacterium]|jgi:beta-glucosidase
MEHWFREKYCPSLPLGKDGRRVTASAEHIEISKKAAEEGMVLLKNDGGVLPLAEGSRAALFGKATIDFVKGGGGSGDVNVPYVHNLADGFRCLGNRVCIFPDTIPFYEEYVRKQYAEGYLPGMVREPEIPEGLIRKAAAYADTAIFSISRFSGEGWDRRSPEEVGKKRGNTDSRLLKMSDEIFERGDYYLSAAEEKALTAVENAFPRVIVVLNIGGIISAARFAGDPKIQSVLLAWQGGMEGGLAEAEMIAGLAEPSGRLADTFVRDLSDYPSTADYLKSDDYLDYSEDIYVGYRYFETVPGAAEKVVYPFGYGLSYTSFSTDVQKAEVSGGTLTVRAEVTNTGSRPGRETVQVYVGAPQGKLGKPSRVLAGYRKTRRLAPGESELVVIGIPVGTFASYDDLGKVRKSAWVLEKGDYHFYVGSDVRRAKETSSVWHLAEDMVVSQLSEKLAPEKLPARMLSDGTMEKLPQRDAAPKPAKELKYDGPAWEDGMAPAVRARARHNFWGGEDKPVLADVADGKLSLDEFVGTLSDEDLEWLLCGQPNTGVANTFGYGNNDVRGIPGVMTADGPAGLRVTAQTGVRTTAFPCSTLLACAWDPAVTETVGAAAASEVRENNIACWLAPAMNIHRNPLCGRNFEYYSEDPLLAGKQAAGMVRGIQSQRIAATVKHFAFNSKETNRRDVDSRVSERAAREIYLRQFEIVVKEAHPWCLMSSYNKANSRRTSENRELLTDILRGEWGFDGMVTTDWWNKAEQYKEVAAGNDVKMGCGYPEQLAAALSQGLLTREDLARSARRVLALILKLE